MKVAMTKDWSVPITDWIEVLDEKAALKWVRTWAKEHHRFIKEYCRFCTTEEGNTIIDFGDHNIFGMYKGE